MQSDRTCSPAPSGRGVMRNGDLARPAVGAGDEPLPPRPDRRRGLGASGRRNPGRAPVAGPSDHRQRRPGDPADDAAAVCPALAADLPGALRWSLSAGRHRGAEAQGEGEAAPSAPAPTAAASGAQASVLPSVLPPFPLPYPRPAPDGVTTASTASCRWLEVPSRGVARKNRARLPGSRWCGSARQDERVRPAGEEKRPANPGRAAIYGLGVMVNGTASGIDPDPSAPRPSAAPDAPQDVTR
jgi:hypothetical protein